MSPSEPPTYPPDLHIVRDLGPVIERGPEGAAILLPIVPEISDAGGRPRVGVLATVIDIIAGETAIREVLPSWVATSNLSLHVGPLPQHGTLRARPRVLRHGRTTLVMEVDVDHVETGDPLGLSTIGFSILPSRSALQARVDWAEKPEARTEFASEGSGLTKPLLETLGVVFDPAEAAHTRLAASSYVINTLGAMQGGVVAILIDAAADHFAAQRSGRVSQLRGLEIHYLKLARVGPVRADVRTLSETASGLLLRVSLHDEGADNVLLTVATVMVDKVSS
jgi:acyl-coenzyme A thioesterase PaaI-like protein